MKKRETSLPLAAPRHRMVVAADVWLAEGTRCRPSDPETSALVPRPRSSGSEGESRDIVSPSEKKEGKK